MPTHFQNYHDAVSYIESIHNLGRDDYMNPKGRSLRSYYNERFAFFLKRLGNPHKGLNYLHVAGSGGKGSTSVMIQSILSAAGYKTGVFTSPFVTTTIEKFKINDKLISPNDFAKLVEHIKPAIDYCHDHSPYGHPSYFEICTAIAFLYFKQEKCQYVVLETGLGGRYDSTNVIPAPKVTILTHIHKDHTDLLGKNISSIAQEKAGIIKKGSLVLVGNNTPAVQKIFEQTCKEVGATYRYVRLDTTYKLNLTGTFQQHNAALAAAAATHMGVKKRDITKGLERAILPCRFEIIQQKPLLILDGGHNKEKINSNILNLENLTYKKLFLIIALTHDRQPQEVFLELLKIADHVSITRYTRGARRAMAPGKMHKLLSKRFSHKRFHVTLDPYGALNYALQKATKDDCILVAGSLFLAGQLRTHWIAEEKILKQRHI